MHNFSRFIIISSFFLTLFFGCQSEPIVVDILIQNGTFPAPPSGCVLVPGAADSFVPDAR